MKKENIKWKVVTNSRRSVIYKTCKILNESLYYFKGNHVKPIPNTPGILVFDTFENAFKFKEYLTHPFKFMIIRVKPIGEQKKILV